MSEPLWVIQTNVGPIDEVERLEAALDEAGIAHTAVKTTMFDPELPAVRNDGPVIWHGSAGLMERVAADGRWTPGVWHHPDRFCWRAWSTNYGAKMLNSRGTCVVKTIKQAAKLPGDPERLVFVRPDADTKSFTGTVMTRAELMAWAQNVLAGGLEPLTADTQIVIGQPFGIEREWRVFMVDGEPVAASQYHWRGELDVQRGAPDEILTFAGQCARQWMPASVFTLDLCLSAGRPWILEAQGFNGSGFYAADLFPLVRAVTAAAARSFTSAGA